MKTMFTIDLLKGRGVPPKSGPTGVAIAVVMAAVPVIIAITTVGLFMRNRIVMSLVSREIASLETKVSGLSDAVDFQRAMEIEKTYHNNYLSEVKTAVKKYHQWSSVLAILAENMPASVALTRLDVKQNSVKKKVPNKDTPGETVEISVPLTTMSVKMIGEPLPNNDEAIRELRDYLRSSPVLGPQLEKVGVSKESGVVDGQDVVYYLMDCVFKLGL
jgi:Tfp pilus assembly protein PilN